MPTDFLAIPDFSRDELESLFVLAQNMRDGKYKDRPLEGKTLAMIFMKASTRTRVSFEVGTYQLGGHALFLSPRDVQRSEEHTSELQSQSNLVCRLLLEKKKKHTPI